MKSPLICEWCGRRVRVGIGCEDAWWPLRLVCTSCWEELDRLDAEACRGGIRRWSGPHAEPRRGSR
jgi:hypothetical protein